MKISLGVFILSLETLTMNEPIWNLVCKQGGRSSWLFFGQMICNCCIGLELVLCKVILTNALTLGTIQIPQVVNPLQNFKLFNERLQ